MATRAGHGALFLSLMLVLICGSTVLACADNFIVNAVVSGTPHDGDPQIGVIFDGQVVGSGPVTARHAQDEWQELAFNLSAPTKPQAIGIGFMNGGDGVKNGRELYVQYATINGVTVDPEKGFFFGTTDKQATVGANTIDRRGVLFWSVADLAPAVAQPAKATEQASLQDANTSDSTNAGNVANPVASSGSGTSGGGGGGGGGSSGGGMQMAANMSLPGGSSSGGGSGGGGAVSASPASSSTSSPTTAPATSPAAPVAPSLAPVPPGPTQIRHIKEWVHCDGKADDWAGVVQAFDAAKNNAFSLQVDCPVFIHVGMDIARPIFVDNGTYVIFTDGGQFIVDNALVPSFVITDSTNIVFANWKVKYVGTVPMNYHTDGYYNNGVWIPGDASPAGFFNDRTRTTWLKEHRGIKFLHTGAVWVGPTNLSALVFIEGDSQNVTVVNMTVTVPPDAPPNKFMPMVFSFTPGYKSNVTAVPPPPPPANDSNITDYAPLETIIATPSNLTFSNITLDGYYMGFQGTLQNGTFNNITALRYSDLQDSNGGTVGGVNAWLAPPHLFYFNGRQTSAYDPYNDHYDPVLNLHNITITHVHDNGPHVGTGVRTVGGFDNSLKISGVNVLVDDYFSNRPDGLLQIYQCNGMKLSNITAVYDSSFLKGLYPGGMIFPNAGYYQNLTLENVTMIDTAAIPQSVPVGGNNNPHWSLGNEHIKFKNVTANLKQLPQDSSRQPITNLQPIITGTDIDASVTVNIGK